MFGYERTGPMGGNRLKMQEEEDLIQKGRFSLEKWKQGGYRAAEGRRAGF